MVGVRVEKLLATSCGGGSTVFADRAGVEELPFIGFPSLFWELGREEESKGGGSFRGTVPFLPTGAGGRDILCELFREDMPGLETLTQSGSSLTLHGLLGLLGFGTTSFELLGG